MCCQMTSEFKGHFKAESFIPILLTLLRLKYTYLNIVHCTLLYKVHSVTKLISVRCIGAGGPPPRV